MSGPLLAVDGPSLLFRAFFALPKSITDDEGRPVNALLGTANLILQAHERFSPRATVLCWGAEAAEYRVEAYEGYHADRPEVPDELQHQFEDVVPFFQAFGIDSLVTEDLEADDLLGALAAAEEEAGGTAILFTGDRDMFQCVNERTVVLFPGAKGGPEVIDAGGVRSRYGIDPEQVPDFIALRGDPSDGLPGAKGIGAKTAAQLLAEHGTLDALLELPLGLTPRQRQALETQADELRTFREIATLQPADVVRPPDRPLDAAGAAAAAHERGMHRLGERLEKLAAA